MPATKPRKPATFEHAMQRVIGVLTADGAAEAVGKSRPLVYAWGDGDDDRLPNLQQAAALDRACASAGGGTPIGDVYAERIGQAQAPKPSDVELCFRRVAAAAGAVSQHYQRAMEDGRLDVRERKQLVDDAYRITDEVRAFVEAVEPPEVVEDRAKRRAG